MCVDNISEAPPSPRKPTPMVFCFGRKLHGRTSHVNSKLLFALEGSYALEKHTFWGRGREETAKGLWWSRKSKGEYVGKSLVQFIAFISFLKCILTP